ncbi:MAG: PAS domain S-box protein [Desulfomonilaceae bacterium]
MKSKHSVHSPLGPWLALFLALTAVTMLVSYTYYTHENQRIRKAKYAEIAAIGKLKADFISKWRKNLSTDTTAATSYPFFRTAVMEWLHNPADRKLKKEIRAKIGIEKHVQGYQDVIISDMNGRVLVSVNPNPEKLNPLEKTAIQQAATRKVPILSDLYRSSGGAIQLSVVGPMLDIKGDMRAAYVTRVNPESDLFPFVENWPGGSQTAETLLVRKDGDDVLFLNNLRFKSNTALSLRWPLTLDSLPAVQAVKGKQGLFLGTDYRGAKVLGDLLPIPDSSWFMVAKVDTKEILAEAHYRYLVVTMFSALFILLTACFSAYGYRRQQARVYESLYELEKEQRKADQLFRTTLYSISDAVITTDSQGFVRHMNATAEGLTGWQENEARGRSVEEVFHIEGQDSCKPVSSSVQQVLAGGPITELAHNAVLVSRDGIQRSITDCGAPILDDNGSITGMVLVFRDQTEERVSQKALADALSEVSQIFDISVPLCIIEKDYKISKVNQSFCSFFGLEKEEILGRNCHHIWDRPFWQNQELMLSQVLSEKEQRTFEIEKHFSGGRSIWILVSAKPFMDDTGQTLGILETFTDITERKHAEEALREREETLELFIDSAPASIAMFDKNMRYLAVSRRWIKDYRLGDRDVIGRSLYEIFPELPERWKEAHRKGLEGEVLKADEDSLQRMDGTTHWLHWEIRPWFSSKNVVGGIVLFSEDITERKLAEDALVTATEALKQSNKDLEQFAYVAAHDLREPLVSVGAYLKILERRMKSVLDDKAKRYLDKAISIVLRMDSMLQALLAQSRLALAPLAYGPTDCNPCFKRALSNLSLAVAKSGATVTSDLLPTVNGDPYQLTQLFQNLIGNALKFGSSDQVQVHVGVSSNDSEHQFSVSDNGIGIEPPYLDRIFTMFERVNDREGPSGTGIGLATCRRIVERHGGRIWVESRPGKGSTFYFTLPVIGTILEN